MAAQDMFQIPEIQSCIFAEMKGKETRPIEGVVLDERDSIRFSKGQGRVLRISIRQPYPQSGQGQGDRRYLNRRGRGCSL